MPENKITFHEQPREAALQDADFSNVFQAKTAFELGFDAGYAAGTASRDDEVGVWIPTSERLPEEAGRYLITYFRRGDGRYLVRMAFFYAGRFERIAESVSANKPYCDVVAWMPLPKPFEMEGKR